MLIVCGVAIYQTAFGATCDSAPYGDSQESYEKLVTGFSAGADKMGRPDITRELAFMAQQAAKSACKVKLEGADRTEFHSLGLTNQDIETYGVSVLAFGYLTRKVNKQVQESSGAKAASSPKQRSYEQTTVKDFVLDAPTLLAKHAGVRVQGQYVKDGNIDMLYANLMGVAMAQDTSQPHIYLRPEHASRSLREKMLNCASDPATSQLGCPLALSGVADDCVLTNGFGASRHEICLDVEDVDDTAVLKPTPMRVDQAREERMKTCVDRMTASGSYNDQDGQKFVRDMCEERSK